MIYKNEKWFSNQIYIRINLYNDGTMPTGNWQLATYKPFNEQCLQ